MRDEPEYLTLHQIAGAAKARLKPGEWDYLMGGSETETTLKRNRLAIDSIAFRPRVLRRVSSVDCTSRLLGRTSRLPILLAPIGSLETFYAGGGAAGAKAAAEFGIPMMLSSQSSPGLEATAAAAPGAFLIYQLYVRGDAAEEDSIVRRAIDAGYHAFCVTVDSAHYSRRERDIATRFVKPWRTKVSGAHFQADYNWENVKRFKHVHDIPLILKGIATAEDAAEAVRHGVDGIYISNHGGRQLDHGRGTLDVLPEVVEAAGGRAEIIVDGGFMRGTDAVKAIALGASAVGMGRMFALAMAAGGETAVARMLQLVEEEIKIALALLGAPRLSDLEPSHTIAALPVGHVHGLSAFPLLAEGY
jgi:isopentenyl diphosphate isomerase/L-lactate dehydrogenase-like FMN-dependent dehydrogenase